MAKIEIEIKDDVYNKLVEACAAKYNYAGKAPVASRRMGIPAVPVEEADQADITKEEFLVAIIKKEFLTEVIKTGSIMVAQRNATKQAQDELKNIEL